MGSRPTLPLSRTIVPVSILLRTVDQSLQRAYLLSSGLLTLSDAAIGPNKARGPGSFPSDAWKPPYKALA